MIPLCEQSIYTRGQGVAQNWEISVQNAKEGGSRGSKDFQVEFPESGD